MRFRRAFALTAAAAALIPATMLFAHGRFPATVSIAFHPGHGDDLLIGTTFGALISHDRGASWSVACEEAIGYRMGFDPTFLWLEDGTMLAATLDGLLVSRDGACSWAPQTDLGTFGVSDVVQHPTEPATLLATAKTATRSSALFRSTDSARTFTRMPLETHGALLSSIRVAPSDPQRWYAGAWYFSPTQTWIERSDDGGAHWTETELHFADPGTLSIVAVSPVDADVVFAKVSGVDADYLARSTDGGHTFDAGLSLPDGFRSVALSADGMTVWAAGSKTFHRSTDGGRSYQDLQKPAKNTCVARNGAELWACGYQWDDGFELGKSTTGGDDWTKVYKLADLGGVLQCPAGTPVATECPKWWPLLATSLGIELPPDAGTDPGPPGSPDGGTTLDPAEKSSCACATTGSASSGATAFFGLAAAALALRTRARKRPR